MDLDLFVQAFGMIDDVEHVRFVPSEIDGVGGVTGEKDFGSFAETRSSEADGGRLARRQTDLLSIFFVHQGQGGFHAEQGMEKDRVHSRGKNPGNRRFDRLPIELHRPFLSILLSFPFQSLSEMSSRAKDLPRCPLDLHRFARRFSNANLSCGLTATGGEDETGLREPVGDFQFLVQLSNVFATNVLKIFVGDGEDRHVIVGAFDEIGQSEFGDVRSEVATNVFAVHRGRDRVTENAQRDDLAVMFEERIETDANGRIRQGQNDQRRRSRRRSTRGETNDLTRARDKKAF